MGWAKTLIGKIDHRSAILGSSFVVMIISSNTYAFGIFLKPLAANFGWSRGGVSLAYSSSLILIGVFSFIMGSLSDRLGARRVVMIGGASMGLGMLLMSRIESLWQLYLIYGLLIGGLGSGSFPVPVISNITRWFSEKKGLATALTYSGHGIGMLLIAPLSRFLIDSFGVRSAYAILGLIIWAVIFPVAALLKSPGQACQVQHNGAKINSSGGAAPLQSAALEYAYGDKGRVWLLRFANFFCCVCHSIILVHFVAYATDVGVPNLTAAAIFGAIGIFSVCSRVTMGVISDRIGGARALIICSAIQTSMALWLLGASSIWSFYFFAFVFGMGLGGIIPQYPLILREMFGQAPLGRIYGSVFLFDSLGMATGGFLGGLLFDLTGGYSAAFTVSFFAGLVNLTIASTLLTSLRRYRAAIGAHY